MTTYYDEPERDNWHCISGGIKQDLSNLNIGDKYTLRYDSKYASNDHITEREVEFLGVDNSGRYPRLVLRGSKKDYDLTQKGMLHDHDTERDLAGDARIHKGDGYWIADICIRPVDVTGVRREMRDALERQEKGFRWVGGTRVTYNESYACRHCDRRMVECGVNLTMCTTVYLCDECARDEIEAMQKYIDEHTDELLGETFREL